MYVLAKKRFDTRMTNVKERRGGEGHDPRVSTGHFWRHAMTPSTSLKLGAAVFAVLWTACVVWWSGALDPISIVMLTLYGGLAGYYWYRLMRLGLKLLAAVARTESDGAEQAQERHGSGLDGKPVFPARSATPRALVRAAAAWQPVREAKRHATKVWTRGREAGIAQMIRSGADQ
jgi:hypothetical protein